ncbi:HNH endonuclease signature motif containing protein [Saccharopolyspora hattusasensis]|uniref:HNH endonuclease signature motif containing protein n=1 Tax=Saccharopolyspora hattusasensis TaxID=1128679 RepID=UPI003D99A823
MSNRRSYSSGTEKALFLLSRGYCYAPTCQEPVLRRIDGKDIVHVEIAHICAREKGGARFAESIPEGDRNNFENLILLCTAHHKLVDGLSTRDEYPVEILRQWKANREGDQAAELEGLRGLTEERLQELMSGAIDQTRTNLESAIAKLDANSREAADMLRSMLAETFDRPYLDLDAVASLEHSARIIQNLPDWAHMLEHAARPVEGLADNATMLEHAARPLAGLADTASILEDATRPLAGLADNATMLEQASRPLTNLADNAMSLKEAAKRVESAIPGEALERVASLGNSFRKMSNGSSSFSGLEKTVDRMERLAADMAKAPPVLQIDDQQRWLYFKWGLGIGVGVSIVLFVLWFTSTQPA